MPHSLISQLSIRFLLSVNYSEIGTTPPQDKLGIEEV